MSEEPTAEEANGTTTNDQTAVEPRVAAPDRAGLKMADAASFSADNLIGVTVYNTDNENIGEVSDVILTKDGGDGAIEAVILDVGGFVGIGEKPVAVSFDSLEIMADENDTLYAYSKFTKEQLEAAAYHTTLTLTRRTGKPCWFGRKDKDPGRYRAPSLASQGAGRHSCVVPAAILVERNLWYLFCVRLSPERGMPQSHPTRATRAKGTKGGRFCMSFGRRHPNVYDACGRRKAAKASPVAVRVPFEAAA